MVCEKWSVLKFFILEYIQKLIFLNLLSNFRLIFILLFNIAKHAEFIAIFSVYLRDDKYI